jgi:hypothetical protein
MRPLVGQFTFSEPVFDIIFIRDKRCWGDLGLLLGGPEILTNLDKVTLDDGH